MDTTTGFTASDGLTRVGDMLTMDAKAAAAAKQVTEQAVRKACTEGRLPGAQRVGYRWRIPIAALRHWNPKSPDLANLQTLPLGTLAEDDALPSVTTHAPTPPGPARTHAPSPPAPNMTRALSQSPLPAPFELPDPFAGHTPTPEPSSTPQQSSTPAHHRTDIDLTGDASTYAGLQAENEILRAQLAHHIHTAADTIATLQLRNATLRAELAAARAQ